MRATQANLQAEIDGLEAQRKEIEGRIRQLGREVGQLAPRAGFDETATRELGHLQARMRDEQLEAAKLNEHIVRLRKRMLDSDELTGALEAFDPLWDRLSPTHKARLIHLLVDRIEYDGDAETVAVTFHPTGIRSLTDPPQENKTCQPA